MQAPPDDGDEGKKKGNVLVVSSSFSRARRGSVWAACGRRCPPLPLHNAAAARAACAFFAPLAARARPLCRQSTASTVDWGATRGGRRAAASHGARRRPCREGGRARVFVVGPTRAPARAIHARTRAGLRGGRACRRGSESRADAPCFFSWRVREREKKTNKQPRCAPPLPPKNSPRPATRDSHPPVSRPTRTPRARAPPLAPAMRPPGGLVADPKAALFPNVRRVLAATAPVVPLSAVSEAGRGGGWARGGGARWRRRTGSREMPEARAGAHPRLPYPLVSQPTDGGAPAFSLADLWCVARGAGGRPRRTGGTPRARCVNSRAAASPPPPPLFIHQVRLRHVVCVRSRGSAVAGAGRRRGERENEESARTRRLHLGDRSGAALFFFALKTFSSPLPGLHDVRALPVGGAAVYARQGEQVRREKATRRTVPTPSAAPRASLPLPPPSPPPPRTRRAACNDHSLFR